MVRTLVRRLNDIKLRDKMALSFLVFMVLPQILLGILVLQEFRRATLDDALGRAGEEVTRLQRQCLDVLDAGLRISERLAVDGRLETLLTTVYPSSLEVFQAYYEFGTFRLYEDISPQVSRIQVYADNPTLLDNWEIRPLTDEVRRSSWFQEARRHPNANGWFLWTDETKTAANRLSLVRYLRYPLERKEAVVVISFDSTRLDSLLRKEGFETLVLDPNRWVVASSRAELAGKPLADARLLSLVNQAAEGTSEERFQGQSSWVFLRDLRSPSTFDELQIACVVDPRVVLKDADRVSLGGLALLLGGALVSLLFLWAVYTLFARRLETLSRRLPEVAAGDFDGVIPLDGKDEIGQLAAGFNAMVRDIRTLMAEVRESEEAQRRLERGEAQMRLKMLTTQINPHFLFNVLESIRMKAHLGGQTEIASTVKLLGKLMRRNLKAAGGPIPLSEEFENVRCYLEIARFRLEEKLSFRIEAQPGVEGVLVPPLIVEPLVENAIVHGLEPQYGGGSLVLSASFEEGDLAISVADDGVGMNAARHRSLLAAEDDGHVGLKNIHQRLILLYGPNSGLKIEGGVGEGTRVSFRIPIQEGA